MRIAAWVFVVCALFGAIGVFVPSFELRVGGFTLGRRTTLSLYQASANREFARKFLAGYHRSAGKRVGAAVTAALMPRVGKRVKSHLDDVHDAMLTLDDVSDDDAKTGSTALVVTVWVLLALHALMAGLVFTDTAKAEFRRGRVIAAAAVSLVVTVAAIGIHLVSREAVWEANDEIGKDLVELGFGAYMMPVAAIAGFVAISVVLVQLIRAKRRPLPS
ncbi:MAG: hypothetical protein JWO36_6107 [Myxococcales bacterium]|nr:hypothetical protein [Myxococcales bacterium]